MYVKKTVLMHIDEVEKIVKLEGNFKKNENKTRAYFTDNEKKQCSKRARSLYARFIIKECVFDYLSEKMRGVYREYQDLEIIKNNRGKPVLHLYRNVHDYTKKNNIDKIDVSISHSRNWIAVLVVFSEAYRRLDS